jgi:ATP-dependent protease HslVU (ClpYQ) peptidase subunit
MTCIVGYVENGTVWIGGDSVGSSGHLEVEYSPADTKVFIREDILFGCSGSHRTCQLLRHVLVVPKKTQGQEDSEYIYGVLIPAVVKCFKDNEAIVIKDCRVDGELGVLFGYNGKLYALHGYFSAMQPCTPYFASGSGREIAFGSMYAFEQYQFNHKNKMTAEERIGRSIDAAKQFCSGVGGAIYIMSLPPSPSEPSTSKRIQQDISPINKADALHDRQDHGKH